MKISTEITKILNKISNKKNSSSMLRNIFLTDKYTDVMTELKMIQKIWVLRLVPL